MRNIHTLKINKNFVVPILNGEKTFEIRENDRGYNRGDMICFIPVNEKGEHIISYFEPSSELRSNYRELANKVYEITYVLSDFHVDRNYVVFSFKEIIV